MPGKSEPTALTWSQGFVSTGEYTGPAPTSMEVAVLTMSHSAMISSAVAVHRHAR